MQAVQVIAFNLVSASCNSCIADFRLLDDEATPRASICYSARAHQSVASLFTVQSQGQGGPGTLSHI